MFNDIKSKVLTFARQIPQFLSKYKYPIVGAIILLFFGGTIYRIDTLSNPDLDQDVYNQGVIEQEKVVFNQDAIERIDKLDERVVNPTQNLDKNRNNPF